MVESFWESAGLSHDGVETKLSWPKFLQVVDMQILGNENIEMQYNWLHKLILGKIEKPWPSL